MVYYGFYASDGEERPAGGRFGYIRFMLAHLLGPDEKGEEKYA